MIPSQAPSVVNRPAVAGFNPGYLIGAVGKLTKNSSQTCLDLQLLEQWIKEEDEVEGSIRLATSRDGNNGKTDSSQQAVHQIRFLGPWCPLIIPDLTPALNVKLHLGPYEPSFNSLTNRWEFTSGLRADVLIPNPSVGQLPFFLKTIDIGPRFLSDLSGPGPSPSAGANSEHARIPIPPRSQRIIELPRPRAKKTSKVGKNAKASTKLDIPHAGATHEGVSAPPPRRSQRNLKRGPPKDIEPITKSIPEIQYTAAVEGCSQGSQKLVQNDQAPPSANPCKRRRVPSRDSSPGLPRPSELQDQIRASTFPIPSPSTASPPSPKNSLTVPNKQPFSLRAIDEIQKMPGGSKNPPSMMATIEEKQTGQSSDEIRFPPLRRSQRRLQASSQKHEGSSQFPRPTAKRTLTVPKHDRPHVLPPRRSQRNLKHSPPNDIETIKKSIPEIKYTAVVEGCSQGSINLNKHDPAPPSANPCKRKRVPSGPSSPQISDPSELPNQSQASTVQIPTTSFAFVQRPLSSRPPKSPPTVSNNQPFPLKTLEEIQKMPGGRKDPFSVVAIIDDKHTEECTQSQGRATGFERILHLSDSSQPRAASKATCNLSWKTAGECPPWGKALWKVIFLSNVYKLRSTLPDTKIVGLPNQFQWALWCPAFAGAPERFISSTSNPDRFSSLLELTPSDLKAKALALYQSRNEQTTSHTSSRPALPSAHSVPRTISQLGRDTRGQSDLCVKILDLQVDEFGNDRMTVTDYTSNPLLRMAKPDVLSRTNPTPALQFHREHGGNPDNWDLTGSRVMSIHIEPPILHAIYRQFDPAGATGNPYMYDYYGQLVNKFVRLNQLDLRIVAGRDNTDTIEGYMDNPYKRQGYRHEINFDSDPASLARLTDRIVPLTPSQPAYRKLLHDRKIYQHCLKQAA
ncbi:hypothetical protein H4Q26_001366 [Puccinia striiformis f. sp. tritici PST-130]|nr:hypothetical protein Pst134EB_001429 [Puccinia striiformis f. sp. tritici]KAI9601542.1 hypothetical protein H4Q26_001366 [Puccinia striiformis f. sp. tritici PST-130]